MNLVASGKLDRVIVTKRGKEAGATRIEYRALDPACNPYLAFSALLAAGMAGIEGDYELPPEATANLYELTEALLEDARFQASRGFRDQLDRAALSVSNNIAEGFERGTPNELPAFLYIARGSAGEVRSLLVLKERRAVKLAA